MRPALLASALLAAASAPRDDPIPPPRPVPQKVLLAREWPEKRAKLWARVHELQATGKLAEVIPIAEKLVAADRDLLGPDHPLVADSLIGVGNLHRAKGDYAAARLAYLDAAAVYEKAYGKGHWRTAEARSHADSYGRIAAMSGDQQARLQQAHQQADDARKLHEGGEFRKAVELYKSCIATFAELLGPDSYLAIMRAADLASCYSELSQFGEARKGYERVLATTERVLGKNHPHYAALLNGLGKVADATGDSARAVELYERALAINRAALGERAAGCGYNLGNLGAVYKTFGQYTRAEAALREAIDIFRATIGPKHPDYAIALSNLGNVYTERGEYDRAEALHREALDVLLGWGVGGHPAAAMVLNNLSNVYYYAGDYGQAAVLLNRSIAINRRFRGDEHEFVAIALGNLAMIYADAGWHERAIAAYEEALRIERKLFDETHPTFITTLHDLGATYLRVGKAEKAEELLRRAAEARKKKLGPRHPDCALDLRLLSGAAAQLGNYPSAESLAKEAIDLRATLLGPDHPDLSPDLRTLAEVYAATTRDRESLALLRRCLVLEEKKMRQVFGFVTESGMEVKTSMVRSILCQLLTIALRRADDAEARELALTWVIRLKATALDSVCRYRELQRATADSPAVGEQVARARRAFDAYMRRLAEPVGPNEEAFRVQVNALRLEYDRQEADLRRLLEKLRPPATGTDADVSIAAVRDRLPPGAALVEIVRVDPYDFTSRDPDATWKEPRYVALVLTADRRTPPNLIDLGEAAPLERNVKEFREALARAPRELRLSDEKTLDAEFRELAAGVSLRVFGPIRPALRGAKTVLLAPDGVLNLLPFDALAEDGRYLIETFRFRYLTTGRDLLRPKSPTGGGTTVFAGPDFDWKPGMVPEPATDRRLVLRGVDVGQLRGLRWKPLPGAAREADDVRQALDGTAYGPVRVVTGVEARKETFTAVRGPRLLHVATHGFFLPERPDHDPGTQSFRPGFSPLLRSGLVLTGANGLTDPSGRTPGTDEGWLTAEEVAQMNLRGTELVVLSACESGLGDVGQAGEGVFGLRRAFLYAGTRSLLVSLFKVPDVETRELMRDFYRRLGTGSAPAEALYAAKRDLIARRRQQNKAAHPFFWASFVLVGGG